MTDTASVRFAPFGRCARQSSRIIGSRPLWPAGRSCYYHDHKAEIEAEIEAEIREGRKAAARIDRDRARFLKQHRAR